MGQSSGRSLAALQPSCTLVSCALLCPQLLSSSKVVVVRSSFSVAGTHLMPCLHFPHGSWSGVRCWHVAFGICRLQSADVSEHCACAFQLMTGNGGLPHSKAKHREMWRRSDEKQKCLRKMFNGERLGGGLSTLGGDCPLYWKFLPAFGGWGRKHVVALV